MLSTDGHLPRYSGPSNELRILMALSEGRDPFNSDCRVLLGLAWEACPEIAAPMGGRHVRFSGMQAPL